jgi:MiaB/RimO family radical SAM methylthiotransferase
MNGSDKCEPSAYLLNQAATFLTLNGYTISDNIAECDTVLVNTCCVIQSKIKISENLIKEAGRHRNVKMIVVFGCLPGIKKEYEGINNNINIICIGSKELNKLNEYFEHRIPIEEVSRNTFDNNTFIPYQESLDERDYYVLICQGCRYSCSYCNIKLSKGDVLSKPVSEIVSEVRKGVESGHSEFVFLADDCISYGADLNLDLVGLVKEVLAIDPSFKLKISSVFPGRLISLYPSFRELLKTKRISYINIPLQSASQRILKLMKRNYDISKVLEIVKDIKAISNSTILYTHILFNFPTETREEFLKSLEASLFFDEALFITYSDNPLTPASKIEPKVSPDEKDTRIKIAMKFLNTGYKGIVIGDGKVLSTSTNPGFFDTFKN